MIRQECPAALVVALPRDKLVTKATREEAAAQVVSPTVTKVKVIHSAHPSSKASYRCNAQRKVRPFS